MTDSVGVSVTEGVAVGAWGVSVSVAVAVSAGVIVEVAVEFETLQNDFQRLWLAENRDNDGFRELVKRFTYTITPCREKAKSLLSPEE